MCISLVFNETSLPFRSLNDCLQHLPNFFSILRKATANEVHIIRTSVEIGTNWYKIHYADGFSLSQWIAQQPDREFKRYLKRIMDRTKCPLIDSDDTEMLDIISLSDFTLAGNNHQLTPSLGAAFLKKIPVVSFCSMQCWEDNQIAIEWDQLDEQASEIIKKECCVENISQNKHLSFFLEKIKIERQASQDYLKKIVVSGNADYPSLIFCRNVLEKFSRLGIHESLLKKIKYVLEKLDSVIQVTQSESSIIMESGLNISGESQTTRNNAKLKKYRIFRLPDDSLVTFDLHVKNFPDGQRLYFLPDFETKKIYIGYFGKHLPT